MSNVAPFNVIMQVGEIWIAPVGTVMPAIDANTPSGAWALFCNAGALNYDADAIHVIMEHTIEEFIPAGSTMALKAQRTAESIRATVKAVDMSFEALMYALNKNPISTVAAGSGTAGYKSIPLAQGSDVNTLAACIRGYSPYSGDANAHSQVEIPSCYNADGWDIGMIKGATPWGYTLNLKSMLDPSNLTGAGRGGTWKAYNAAPL